MSKASKHTLKLLWEGFEYKPHQLVGVKWMIERDNEDGGIVADEMGLGKTIQLLALLKNSTTSHTLLIAPLAVLDQWKTTAERSSIRVYLLNNKEWVLKTAMFSNRTSIYVCSYETAQRNLRLINGMKFDRLICDEAHRLSNPKTIGFQTIDAIDVSKRWFLTATPIVNSVRDIKSLFKLLRLDDETNMYENIPTYVLARSMSDLENAPLAPIIHTHNLDFVTEEEANFYRGIQDRIVNQLKYGELKGLDKLALLIRLRQVSIHPNVYIEMKRKKNVYLNKFPCVSTKFQKIQHLFNSESEEKHKWIIFCHFHEEMLMLKEFLNTLEYVRYVGIYSGKLNLDERNSLLKQMKEELNDDKTCDVLIIQLQSGGVGLNLQEFDRIIFTSPWWTQSMMNQAVGRAVRIGQTKQVIVHHLHLNEEKTLNIDRLMNEKAKMKGLLNKEILDMANRNVGT